MEAGNICHSFAVTIISAGVEKVFAKTSADGVSLQKSRVFRNELKVLFMGREHAAHTVSKEETAVA